MPTRLHPRLAALETNQTTVCTRLDAAMQRRTDALALGYVHHVGGTVPLSKAASLVDKLQARFPALKDNKNQAYYRKTKARPRHKLIAFANRSSAEFLFHLMTDLPQADDRERWSDARNKRSRLCLYQYEALEVTKAGQAGTSWTWQMQRPYIEEFKALAKLSIRAKAPRPVLAVIEESRTWPGFFGVRTQRSALRASLTAEWIRSMPATEPPPEWPRLRYLQRLRTR